MSPKLQKLLLPFYFGSVTDEERLLVEREMLTDTEVLVDYLDLKRSLEAAPLSALQPSALLWQRIKPKNPAQKKVWISFSIGAALAAGIALALLFRGGSETPELTQPSANRALFDSSSEHSASSGVL
jgi:hypothetical protein